MSRGFSTPLEKKCVWGSYIHTYGNMGGSETFFSSRARALARGRARAQAHTHTHTRL